MENELISVVIPCYNVTRYLNDVFLSLDNQTYKEIEIIFVDDGSTDNTLQMLQNYAKNKSNVTVIHQNNLGVSVARNVAIKKSKGKYLFFFDSDDVLMPKALEILHNVITEYNADIAICRKKHIKDSFNYSKIKKCIINRNKKKERIYENPDIAVSQYLSCNKFAPESINKLYRKEIFEKFTTYPEVYPINRRYMEDVLMQVRCFSIARKSVYTPYKLYCYRRTKKSATHTMFKENMLNIFDGNEFYPFLDPNLFVESQIYINAKYATDNLELLFRIRNSNYSNPTLVRQMYENYKKYLKYCFKAKRSHWYRKYLMWMSRPFLYLLIRKKMK
mgnify:CR=1 FL=1